jgi:hypothetical protein
MEADAIVSYDLEALDTIRITDVSDYSVTPITSVNATRFVFASVNTIANAKVEQTNLLANREYELVGTGGIDIDGKTFNAGDKFILRVDVSVTPPSSLKINETGYYSPVTSYLPTEDYEEFVPSQTGISDETVFPDNIFTCTYDVFTTKYAEGDNFDIGQYILIGGGVIIENVTGYQYRSGEMLNILELSSFNNVSGTNFVVKLESTTTFYFQTYKYANLVYENYVKQIAKGNCSQDLQSNFLKVHTLLHANIINFEKNITVDLQAMQNNLDTINNIYGKTNPYC